MNGFWQFANNNPIIAMVSGLIALWLMAEMVAAVAQHIASIWRK